MVFLKIAVKKSIVFKLISCSKRGKFLNLSLAFDPFSFFFNSCLIEKMATQAKVPRTENSDAGKLVIFTFLSLLQMSCSLGVCYGRYHPYIPLLSLLFICSLVK